ncbi:hypothetical protein Rhal01_02511 [Rubritalea halochordaticola]|uniref:RES domain-containing protein n=1 Tax=Rubritalea halochordaticola TaxID=714537 RepID=A0ABP9V0Y1_9BACT
MRKRELVGSCDQSVFRFVNPRYSSAKEMFAGKGALYVDGRWLLQGEALASYCSLLPETAFAEALSANRYYGFPDNKSAPLVFVTARVKLKKVIDLSDGSVRSKLRFSLKFVVETDWRRENYAGREAITQAWGWAFARAGVEGILCPSAAHREGMNLIVFPRNLLKSSRLQVTSEVEWPRE